MPTTNRYCLALDLENDPEAIQAYDDHHRAVWPDIEQSLLDSGIRVMEIYRTGNRLFMIMETTEDFSFEKKAELDRKNPDVQRWETLMNRYQKRLPGTKPGEKWQLMKRIYRFEA